MTPFKSTSNPNDLSPTITFARDLVSPCEYSWETKKWMICMNCVSYTEFRFCNGEVAHMYDLCDEHAGYHSEQLIDNIWFWQQRAANRTLEEETKQVGFEESTSILLKHREIKYLHANGCNYSTDIHAAVFAPLESIYCYIKMVEEMRIQLVHVGCEDCFRRFTEPLTEVMRRETNQVEDQPDIETHWHKIGLLRRSSGDTSPSSSHQSATSTINNQNLTLDTLNASVSSSFSTLSNIELLAEAFTTNIALKQTIDIPLADSELAEQAPKEERLADTVTADKGNHPIISNCPGLSRLIISTHLPQLSPDTINNIPDPRVDPIIKHCQRCVHDLNRLARDLSIPAAVLGIFSKRCNLVSHNVNGSYLRRNFTDTDLSTDEGRAKFFKGQEASHSFIPFHLLQQYETDMLDSAKPLFTNQTLIEKCWKHNHHLRRQKPEIWHKLYFTYNSDQSCRNGGSWREPLIRQLREERALGPNDELVPLSQTARPGEYVIEIGSNADVDSMDRCSSTLCVSDECEEKGDRAIGADSDSIADSSLHTGSPVGSGSPNTRTRTFSSDQPQEKNSSRARSTQIPCQQIDLKHRRIKDMTDEKAWW